MTMLEHGEVLELCAAVLAAGLVGSRAALLTGIEGGFVAGLPIAPSPSEQVMVDLGRLNQTGALINGQVPLQLWLANAVQLAGMRAERAVFRRFLGRLSSVEHVLSAQKPRLGGAPPATDPSEATREPSPFAALIEEKTRDFVGREYVFSAFDRFMKRTGSGYFIITGHPGAGKSAIVAEYTRRTGCVVHFNQSTLNLATVAVFLESVNDQLAARRGKAPAPLLARAANDGRFLDRLLSDSVPGNGAAPLVVAIDALDEVDVGGARDTPLFLPRALPRGVFILVSTRPAPLFPIDSSSECFDLDAHDVEARRDAAAYVRLMAERTELRDWIDRRRVPLDSFVETLVDKSAGNFMYLRYLLPAIAAGGYESLEIDKLPSGLEAYYEDHWTRMGMRTNPLPLTRLRVLYVLSELFQPISRDLLAAILHEEPLAVQQVLTTWRPFLHCMRIGGQSRHYLYHASFRDFLRRQDVLSASGVSLDDVRGMIATELLRGREDDV